MMWDGLLELRPGNGYVVCPVCACIQNVYKWNCCYPASSRIEADRKELVANTSHTTQADHKWRFVARTHI